MDLKDKNVIYVGGFGGIGFECCKCFLEQDIKKLGIFDLNEDADKLKELQAISKTTQIFFIKVDITQKNNVDAAFAEAHQKMEHFDVVINGSGIMNEQHIELAVQVNFLGVIYCSLAALQYMDKTQAHGGRGGLIANISSVAGIDIVGAYAVYTGTKHGVTAFTRALADPFYYEHTGVSFITICPGGTGTPLTAALLKNPATTFAEQPPVTEFMKEFQSAEVCAQKMLQILKVAKNGAVWIVTGGEVKEHHMATNFL